MTDPSAHATGGVREAPRHEIAEYEARRFSAAYGDSAAAGRLQFVAGRIALVFTRGFDERLLVKAPATHSGSIMKLMHRRPAKSSREAESGYLPFRNGCQMNKDIRRDSGVPS